MNRILFVSVCVAFVVLASRAQIPHSMTESYNARLGGTNYITGTIYWPSGRRVDRRMSIRIRPQTAGEITMSTDTNGQFIVGGLPEGYFYISVDDEPDFEPVNVMVEILLSREQPKPTYTVNIRLKDKLKLQPKPLVVDARVASAPKRAAEAYNRSQELSRKGDHAGAVELLKIAVAEFPAFAEAYNELGVQYMRLNELDKAEAALKDALKTKPDAFEPLLNLGIVLFRLKRTEAEESLRKAVAANQQSPLPHYYLGRLLTAAEKYGEAERELKAAVQFGGSEMKEAHRMLANLYIASGNDARAVEELETYLKLAPDAPDALKLRETIVILKTPKQPAPNTKP